ncbi:MAG: hypothetical protein HDQ87_09700 [Clostridia bacterium]|nr:hypothetical protein [Clostridia bacterium]
MSVISHRLAAWLKQHSGLPVDTQILAYGCECILSSLIIYSLILIIGSCAGNFAGAACWLLFFLPIRISAGGSHAPSQSLCFILSIAVSSGCTMLARFLTLSQSLVAIGLAFDIAAVFTNISREGPHLRRRRRQVGDESAQNGLRDRN